MKRNKKKKNKLSGGKDAAEIFGIYVVAPLCGILIIMMAVLWYNNPDLFWKTTKADPDKADLSWESL